MKKIGIVGLRIVWIKIFDLIKLVTGNVDVASKGDLQTQINNLDDKVNDCFTSASNGKAAIASAITGKGVSTSADATFTDMAANISNIKTTPKLQSKNAELSTAAQTIKPDNGYDGLSQVAVPAVSGTAGTGDVLSGKTFCSAAGVGKIGTLVDKTGIADHSAEASLDAENSRLKLKVPAVAKYGTGNYLYAAYSAIASLIGLTAAKLVKGNTILGITGNSNNMDTSGGTAAAGNILSGKKAAVKGSLITGSMANRGGTTVDAGAVTQDDDYTYMSIPAAGYYDTSSKVRSANSNIQADLSQLSAAGTWGGGCNNSYSASATIPAGTANYVMVYVSLSQFPENGTHISVTNLTELPAFTITNRGYPGVKIFEVVDTTKSASVSAKAGGDYGSPSVTIRSLK